MLYTDIFLLCYRSWQVGASERSSASEWSDDIASMAAVQPGLFAAIAEFRYFIQLLHLNLVYPRLCLQNWTYQQMLKSGGS